MTLLFENDNQAEFDFDIEETLNKVIEYALDYEDFPYEVEVSVSLVSEEEIHRINKEFRQVDRPTDVLSFPMMEYERAGDFQSETFEQSLTVSYESEEVMLGDIVLCSQVIKRQAKEYGHSELREFAFLVVHSVLHLLGYDHMEDDERLEMEDHQRKIMEGLQISRGDSK
ncbi:MAG: rRNA maturation RNase YbeY [Eubacterium sp.]|nr:rRNA maturation RNase YbeY [Eubacterium sp.]